VTDCLHVNNMGSRLVAASSIVRDTHVQQQHLKGSHHLFAIAACPEEQLGHMINVTTKCAVKKANYAADVLDTSTTADSKESAYGPTLRANCRSTYKGAASQSRHWAIHSTLHVLPPDLTGQGTSSIAIDRTVSKMC